MLIKSYGEKNTVQGELAYIFKDSWRSCINFKDLWSRTKYFQGDEDFFQGFREINA